ncbi:MAG: hypothetical protein IT236_09075 [Bacteroidia bacterium]|nr:hypothetical protein [Bacteroidia bacterium]
MLKKHFGKYGGILIAGLYGLFMRIIFGLHFNGSFADLFSITFVWILPFVVGLTPLIFSPKEDLQSSAIRIFRPVLAVLAFFTFCYWTGHEDFICLLIISIPYLIAAGLAGLLLGGAILYYRQKKGILYSVFFIPLVTGFIEPAIPTPSQSFETTSSIIINASKSDIWSHIVRVNEIKNEEYDKGFFNYSGIPRPLYAELDADTLGGTRIGHFEGGLKFEEKIIQWNKNNLVCFDIKIIPSNTNRTIFERHMLSGQHFKFLNATYQLKEISDKQTELLLTTQYQLDTKINFYGEFWAQQLLTDFQNRLLSVIKTRCEKPRMANL